MPAIPGHRLLVGLLGGDHDRKEAHPRRMDPLPLGWTASAPTMSPIGGGSKLELNGFLKSSCRTLQKHATCRIVILAVSCDT